MKRVLWALVFAVIGVIVCIGIQLLTAATGFAPRFPAFAGEDDFDLRFRYFLFMVCPAFALLGAWIGSAFGKDPRAGGLMWLGVLGGSLVTFLVARLLGSAISDLSTQAAANHGVLVLLAGWIALAALGAYGARSLVPRR